MTALIESGNIVDKVAETADNVKNKIRGGI